MKQGGNYENTMHIYEMFKWEKNKNYFTTKIKSKFKAIFKPLPLLNIWHIH